jgi:hypothetical protein
MKEGFITDDGYAAVPYGKKNLIIIHGGYQLEMVSTTRQAHKYIKEHRSQSQPGTVFL